MARPGSLVFFVFIFTSNFLLGSPRRLIRRSASSSLSGSDMILTLIARVPVAEQECGDAGSTTGSELMTCFLGFDGTPSFGDENFAVDATRLLGCFDSYKSLLERCTTYTGRDNDLALLDVAQVALANNGELINEIQSAQLGRLCRDRAESNRIATLMRKCYQDEGLSLLVASSSKKSLAELAVGNVCGDLSAIKTCMIKGKNSNPCPEARRDFDFILSIFDNVEAKAEHKDVMGRCLNGGGGGGSGGGGGEA